MYRVFGNFFSTLHFSVIHRNVFLFPFLYCCILLGNTDDNIHAQSAVFAPSESSTVGLTRPPPPHAPVQSRRRKLIMFSGGRDTCRLTLRPMIARPLMTSCDDVYGFRSWYRSLIYRRVIIP